MHYDFHIMAMLQVNPSFLRVFEILYWSRFYTLVWMPCSLRDFCPYRRHFLNIYYDEKPWQAESCLHVGAAWLSGPEL